MDQKREMLDAIDSMRGARIGHSKKWNKISKKISSDVLLSPAESEYYVRLTRIYAGSNSGISSPRHTGSRYHTELSEDDERPRCAECGEQSWYYCHMNDQYFCRLHIIGHDPNE